MLDGQCYQAACVGQGAQTVTFDLSGRAGASLLLDGFGRAVVGDTVPSITLHSFHVETERLVSVAESTEAVPLKMGD